MRAREFVTEAFDRPYAMTWEHGDESHDALVRLPDGGTLSIMFSLDYGDYGDEEWTVEFYRNFSQEITGEGDQQRIFATVLEAIREFVAMEHPEHIRFSANKDVEPGQKAQTRTNLYNRLVQRYASSLGYQTEISDFGGSTVYNLFKLYEGLNEADASAVKFQTASTDNYQSSFTVSAIADGKTVGHFSFFRDPETDDVHNQAEVTDDVRGKGYGKALLLKAIEVANNHGLGFQEDSQSLSHAQSRVYDSLYDAGWIVDADGYWFLTPEGQQELSRLSTAQGVAEEQLDELTFLGSQCTKDCSGHRAGYEWSKRKGLRQANSWSPSFNKGAGLAVAGK